MRSTSTHVKRNSLSNWQLVYRIHRDGASTIMTNGNMTKKKHKKSNKSMENAPFCFLGIDRKDDTNKQKVTAMNKCT